MKKTASIFPRFSLIIFLEVSKQSVQLLDNVEALPDTKEKNFCASPFVLFQSSEHMFTVH